MSKAGLLHEVTAFSPGCPGFKWSCWPEQSTESSSGTTGTTLRLATRTIVTTDSQQLEYVVWKTSWFQFQYLLKRKAYYQRWKQLRNHLWGRKTWDMDYWFWKGCPWISSEFTKMPIKCRFLGSLNQDIPECLRTCSVNTNSRDSFACESLSCWFRMVYFQICHCNLMWYFKLCICMCLFCLIRGDSPLFEWLSVPKGGWF